MNFIIDNYLWFGIAGVVLLMALIGFLAEKTNFIVSSSERKRKPKKRKKESVNEFMDSEIMEPTIEQASGMELTDDVISTEPVIEENLSSADEVLDFNGSGNSVEPNIISAPLSLDDTWMQPEASNEEVSVVTATGEDLSQPFGDAINVSTEEYTPEVPNVNENLATNVTDDDIWKF